MTIYSFTPYKNMENNRINLLLEFYNSLLYFPTYSFPILCVSYTSSYNHKHNSIRSRPAQLESHSRHSLVVDVVYSIASERSLLRLKIETRLLSQSVDVCQCSHTAAGTARLEKSGASVNCVWKIGQR